MQMLYSVSCHACPTFDTVSLHAWSSWLRTVFNSITKKSPKYRSWNLNHFDFVLCHIYQVIQEGPALVRLLFSGVVSSISSFQRGSQMVPKWKHAFQAGSTLLHMSAVSFFPFHFFTLAASTLTENRIETLTSIGCRMITPVYLSAHWVWSPVSTFYLQFPSMAFDRKG